MAVFVSRIGIERSADEVFRYVSEAGNMPQILPSVRQVAKGEGQRVTMEGEWHGRAYRSEGELKVDAGHRTLHWSGTGGGKEYSGRLVVHQRGGHSDAEVRLHLAAEGQAAERAQNELDEAVMRLKAKLEQGSGVSGKGPVSLDPDRRVNDEIELPDSRPFGHSATMNPDNL